MVEVVYQIPYLPERTVPRFLRLREILAERRGFVFRPLQCEISHAVPVRLEHPPSVEAHGLSPALIIIVYVNKKNLHGYYKKNYAIIYYL